MKCNKCNADKTENDFYTYKRKAYPDRVYRNTICKECQKAGTKRWNRENPEKARELDRLKKRRKRFRKLGITEKDFAGMKKSQKGRCAICGDKPKILCVDHDHETGDVRGLLCNGCNVALGYLKDNPKTAEAAAAYLLAKKVE